MFIINILFINVESNVNMNSCVLAVLSPCLEGEDNRSDIQRDSVAIYNLTTRCQ